MNSPARLRHRGWVDDCGHPVTRLIEKRRTLADKPPVEIMLHVACLAVVIVGLGLWARWSAGIGLNQWVPGWLVWVIIALMWIPILHDGIRRRSARVQIPRRLSCGMCPGCLYALSDLPTCPVEHLEAAVRCPECGAVWHGERVGTLDVG